MDLRKVMTATCPHGIIRFAAVNEPRVIAEFSYEIVRMVSDGYKTEIVNGPVRIGGDCAACEEQRFLKPSHAQAEMFGSGPVQVNARRRKA